MPESLLSDYRAVEIRDRYFGQKQELVPSLGALLGKVQRKNVNVSKIKKKGKNKPVDLLYFFLNYTSPIYGTVL